jgi:hypothetical protein
MIEKCGREDDSQSLKLLRGPTVIILIIKKNPKEV